MKHFKNKESNKVVVVITVFVILALSFTVMTYYGNKTVTAARAYITGQGHWSKAQKDAVISVIRYVSEKDSTYYNQFKGALRINKGDRSAQKPCHPMHLITKLPKKVLSREAMIRRM